MVRESIASARGYDVDVGFVVSDQSATRDASVQLTTYAGKYMHT